MLAHTSESKHFDVVAHAKIIDIWRRRQMVHANVGKCDVGAHKSKKTFLWKHIQKSTLSIKAHTGKSKRFDESKHLM